MKRNIFFIFAISILFSCEKKPTISPETENNDAASSRRRMHDDFSETKIRPDENHNTNTYNADEVLSEVKREIERELYGLTEDDPRIGMIFDKLWSRTLHKSFAEELPSAIDERVRNGKILPPELNDIENTSSAYLESITSGDIAKSMSREEYRSVLYMLFLAVGDSNAGAHNLMRYAEKRNTALPPTYGDFVLANIFTQALKEIKLNDNSKVDLNVLNSLATSKNAVQRLISLQMSLKLNDLHNGHEGIDGVNYYKQFLKEEDHQIVKLATSALGVFANNESVQVLKDFKNQQLKYGNQDIVKHVDEVLKCNERANK